MNLQGVKEVLNQIAPLDWLIIGISLLLIVLIGVAFRKKASSDLASFFLGGRNLPWLVAGISMVATTFAADTPLAVTELVGQYGISGNWLWWNFLLGGMLTTFFFANLWRKSGVLTDVELVELRYGGRSAAFLRGLKSVYFGLFLNILIIGWVNLAMMTILEVFFDVQRMEAFYILGALLLLVGIYSAASGLLGVAITDNIQFLLAMTGSVALAVFVVNSPEIGGLTEMTHKLELAAPESLKFFPEIGGGSKAGALGTTLSLGVGAFLAHMVVQWWASWYPGAEPGGGGYIAQRMMSTKSEKGAVYSTLFFQIAHYCLRPWPWIITGLCAVLLYGNISGKVKDPFLQKAVFSLEQSGRVPAGVYAMDSVQISSLARDNAFIGRIEASLQAVSAQLQAAARSNPELKDALDYQKDKRKGYVLIMKNNLPVGWKGLLLAAFFAAFMSTISTQINWGSSYLVNDFYKRFVDPDAGNRKLVAISRVTTLLILILGWGATLFMHSISGVWTFLIECGAGLGLVLILRWYWWRINAWSEIVATIAPFVAYSIAHYALGWVFPDSFFFTVAFTTLAWLVTTFLTRPEKEETLQKFYQKVQPDGAWKGVAGRAGMTVDNGNLQNLALSWLIAIVMTYSVLFGIGKMLLNDAVLGGLFLSIAAVSAVLLKKYLKRTRIFT